MTPLLAKFLSDDAKRSRRLVHIPMGRFGRADRDRRTAALFLASDDSAFMTGAVAHRRRRHHGRLHHA